MVDAAFKFVNVLVDRKTGIRKLFFTGEELRLIKTIRIKNYVAISTLKREGLS